MEEKDEIQNKRTLQGIKLWGYSSGVLGHILPSVLITAYLSIFFTYTVGLDPFLVGIGSALGSLTNGLCGPIFGYLSDKKKVTKLGKRRVFLLYGLPIFFLSTYLVWFSPLCSTMDEWNFKVAAFFWFFQIAFFLGFALIRGPYLAMLPEQSQDEKNRLKISSIQGVFSILGSIIGILLPMFVQSLLDNPAINGKFHDTPNGQILLRLLPNISLIFAIIGVLFTLFAFYSVDESFLKKTQVEIIKKTNLKDTLKDILVPFRDPDFRLFLISIFLMNAGLRIIVRNLAPYFEFVMFFEGNSFIYFALALIPFAGVGFVFWTKKAKTKGLRYAFVVSNKTITIFLFTTFSLLFIDNYSLRTILALIITGLTIASMVPGYILHFPITSKFSDNAPAHIVKEGSVSGKYFGALLLIYNLANALGDFLVGLLLSGSSGGIPNSENRIFIGLLLPMSAVLYLISVVVFRKSKMK